MSASAMRLGGASAFLSGRVCWGKCFAVFCEVLKLHRIGEKKKETSLKTIINCNNGKGFKHKKRAFDFARLGGFWLTADIVSSSSGQIRAGSGLREQSPGVTAS